MHYEDSVFLFLQSVSARVAEEMGVKLGEEVGYTIRFEDFTNPVGTSVFALLMFIYLENM